MRTFKIQKKGRFLVMQVNHTPHLNSIEDIHLKTGGSLKDGWSYLMPQDQILLYSEVTSAFADELDDHVKEQTKALRKLYLPRQGSGSLLRQKDDGSNDDVTDRSSTCNNNADNCDDENKHVEDKTTSSSSSSACIGKNGTKSTNEIEMTFVIQRGLQVVGCVTYNDETGEISDMIVRPSAKDCNLEKELISAVITHAEKQGQAEIISKISYCREHDGVFKDLGFEPYNSDESTGMKLVMNK